MGDALEEIVCGEGEISLARPHVAESDGGKGVRGRVSGAEIAESGGQEVEETFDLAELVAHVDLAGSVGDPQRSQVGGVGIEMTGLGAIVGEGCRGAFDRENPEPGLAPGLAEVELGFFGLGEEMSAEEVAAQLGFDEIQSQGKGDVGRLVAIGKAAYDGAEGFSADLHGAEEELARGGLLDGMDARGLVDAFGRFGGGQRVAQGELDEGALDHARVQAPDKFVSLGSHWWWESGASSRLGQGRWPGMAFMTMGRATFLL